MIAVERGYSSGVAAVDVPAVNVLHPYILRLPLHTG